jgi:hypothetical protein
LRNGERQGGRERERERWIEKGRERERGGGTELGKGEAKWIGGSV